MFAPEHKARGERSGQEAGADEGGTHRRPDRPGVLGVGPAGEQVEGEPVRGSEREQHPDAGSRQAEHTAGLRIRGRRGHDREARRSTPPDLTERRSRTRVDGRRQLGGHEGGPETRTSGGVSGLLSGEGEIRTLDEPNDP